MLKYFYSIKIFSGNGRFVNRENYYLKSDSSDGCSLWVEIAVTAVTPYLTKKLSGLVGMWNSFGGKSY